MRASHRYVQPCLAEASREFRDITRRPPSTPSSGLARVAGCHVKLRTTRDVLWGTAGRRARLPISLAASSGDRPLSSFPDPRCSAGRLQPAGRRRDGRDQCDARPGGLGTQTGSHRPTAVPPLLVPTHTPVPCFPLPCPLFCLLSTALPEPHLRLPACSPPEFRPRPGRIGK